MLTSRSRAEYHNPAFAPLHEIVARTGLSESAVRRRLRVAGVTTWQDPSDSRRRLVRRDEVRGVFDVPKLAIRQEGVAA